MEKTTEEMLNEVLQVCESLRPKEGWCSAVRFKPKHLLYKDEFKYTIYFKEDGGCERPITWLSNTPNEGQIRAFYAIFGLEARDAAQAEREKAECEIANIRLAIKDANALQSAGTGPLLIALDSERAIASKWKARAWKLLGIAREKKDEAFARFIRNAKLESDLKASEARAAKLVEAIENAAKRLENIGRDYEESPEWSKDIDDIEENLAFDLEAYKKGGPTT